MMKQQPTQQTDMAGFTVIEIVVTMVILTIFLNGVIQAYIVQETQRLSLLRQNIASDIAFTNLRKFPTRPGVTTCSTSIDIASSTYNFTPETTANNSSLQALGSGVTQSVIAYPVDGCSGTNFVTQLLRIVSTVTYSGGSISHESYVQ